MKVYHYTSIEAFQKIIEKSELWLSERNCMNDVSDEEYIKGIIKQYLNPNDSPFFKGSFFDRNFITDKPQYVFSTTKDKDAAHQWLNYGNINPICIEFDKEALDKYFIEFSKSGHTNEIIKYTDYFFSSNVIYDKNEIIKRTDQFVSNLIDKWQIEFDNLTSAPSVEFYNAYMDFHKYYSCVKKEQFFAENEYRFLIYTMKESEFRTKGERLISYLKVFLNKILPITSIIISPYETNETCKNTLQLFLRKYKYDNVSIISSELRLRK
jgi:hypothetical protein